MGAIWYSGAALTVTAPGSTLDLATTAGVIYQMHQQSFSAADTSTGDKVHVVNDSTTPYAESSDPETLITADSTGASMANKYFNIVLWGVANKGDQAHSPLMITLPSGSYSTLGQASADTAGYDNFQMPDAFSHESSTGFLIARITLQWSGGTSTLTHHTTVDLRGYNPLTASGGSGTLVGALLQDGSTPLTGDWDTGATYGIDAAFLTSKGNVTIEEGNLYLDKTASPSIFLREGGDTDDYAVLEDNSVSVFNIQKVRNSGASYIRIDPVVTDGTSVSNIQMFRSTTTTSSDAGLLIYNAGGGSTLQHRFNAVNGNVHLNMVGGHTYLDEGNLYLEKSADPSIFLREGGDTDDYGLVLHSGYNGGFPTLRLRSYASSGASASMHFDGFPADGTSTSYIQFHRSTNTTGGSGLLIYKGDGSGTQVHQFFGSGGAQLDATGVNTVVVGNILDVNGRVRLPYLGAAPSTLVNGDMWMESDGLHIYYAGAEKTVAGV
jgi:hypothetical protein